MDNLSEVDMLECKEETVRNVKKLKAMGFVDIHEALKIAKNDINDAVSILTGNSIPRFIDPVNQTKTSTESNKSTHTNSYKKEITIISNQQDTAMQNKNTMDRVGAYLALMLTILVYFMIFMRN
jgi:cell division protein FtsX